MKQKNSWVTKKECVGRNMILCWGKCMYLCRKSVLIGVISEENNDINKVNNQNTVRLTSVNKKINYIFLFVL